MVGRKGLVTGWIDDLDYDTLMNGRIAPLVNLYVVRNPATIRIRIISAAAQLKFLDIRQAIFIQIAPAYWTCISAPTSPP